MRYATIADSLVGLSDIADAVRLSVPAVSNWTKRWEDFPTPLDKISGNPVYAKDEVTACLRRHGQRPYWRQRIRPQVKP